VTDNSPLNSSTWVSCDPSDLVWVDLDEQFAVFHRPSGKTHFLNASSAFILDDILRNPQIGGQVVDKFMTGSESESREQIASGILEMLLHMEELGLVVRCNRDNSSQ
jgi:PqqD family protein of HPr-rel-A system